MEAVSHPGAVRAKFRVLSKEERVVSGHPDYDQVAVEVKMMPVFAGSEAVEHEGVRYALNAVEENRIFGAATPAGSIAMLIKNRAAAEKFEIGRAYYVDFTPAGG